MDEIRYNIAQPCSFKENYTTNKEGNKVKSVVVKSNTFKPFVLLDELQNTDNYQECVKYHTLKTPISYFTEVHKAIENTSSFAKYGYFLVAYNIGIKEVSHLIQDGVVWYEFFDSKTKQPRYLPAFGDREPKNSHRCVTYSDTHLLVGRSRRVKLIPRKDV